MWNTEETEKAGSFGWFWLFPAKRPIFLDIMKILFAFRLYRSHLWLFISAPPSILMAAFFTRKYYRYFACVDSTRPIYRCLLLIQFRMEKFRFYPLCAYSSIYCQLDVLTSIQATLVQGKSWTLWIQRFFRFILHGHCLICDKCISNRN